MRQLKPESIVLLSKESTVLYHVFIRLICTLLFSFLQTNANSCWLVSPWTNSKITAFSANLLFCCHAFALVSAYHSRPKKGFYRSIVSLGLWCETLHFHFIALFHSCSTPSRPHQPHQHRSLSFIVIYYLLFIVDNQLHSNCLKFPQMIEIIRVCYLMWLMWFEITKNPMNIHESLNRLWEDCVYGWYSTMWTDDGNFIHPRCLVQIRNKISFHFHWWKAWLYFEKISIK